MKLPERCSRAGAGHTGLAWFVAFLHLRTEKRGNDALGWGNRHSSPTHGLDARTLTWPLTMMMKSSTPTWKLPNTIMYDWATK